MNDDIVLTDTPALPRDKRAPRASTHCPQCGAKKEKRTKSAGFGQAHPVCSCCGYEWTNEVWRE